MDLLLRVDRIAEQALRDQVYDGIRAAILDGRLPAGARLPSRRVLATDLGVARFTIEDAYARLASEGYITGRHGAGTFVTLDPGGIRSPATTPMGGIGRSDAVRGRTWSRWGQRLTEIDTAAHDSAPLPFDFRHGLPAIDLFPQALWRRLLAREARVATAATHSYGSPLGYAPLRQAIAAYVGRSRALRCDPAQIVITSGLQQAVDLLTRLWLDPGDAVVMEEPSYPSARAIFRQAGAAIIPVPVDRDGLRVDLVQPITRAKLIYVTPAHQYPTGGVLPMARRSVLLDWARRHGTLVIEDEYDSEFRYGARPVEPLAALDAAGVVAYVGTFSKVLYPSLRIGYVILPPDMVGRFAAAKELADRQQSTLLQATLAAFIREGHFERHLARMRRLYARRQTALVSALNRHLGDRVWRDPAATAAGLHVLAGFATKLSEAELVTRAAAEGIGLDPGGPCFTTPPAQPTARLGYALLPEAMIDEGIRRLAGIVGQSPVRTVSPS